MQRIPQGRGHSCGTAHTWQKGSEQEGTLVRGGRSPISRPSLLLPTARLHPFPLLILTDNAPLASLVSRVIRVTLRINHHKDVSKPQDLPPGLCTFSFVIAWLPTSKVQPVYTPTSNGSLRFCYTFPSP